MDTEITFRPVGKHFFDINHWYTLDQITGGQFSLNEADFGGFLYKEGDGTATCEGATIRLNQGVDGGAIYAVEDAVLDWACDLIGNSALAGPAM